MIKDLEQTHLETIEKARKLKNLLKLIEETALQDFEVVPATVDFNKAGIYLDLLGLAVGMVESLEKAIDLDLKPQKSRTIVLESQLI